MPNGQKNKRWKGHDSKLLVTVTVSERFGGGALARTRAIRGGFARAA